MNDKDTIYRQAAIEIVDWYQHEFSECDYAFGELANELHKLPSAQPEIIRCKDCKHYDGRPCGIVDWYNTADDFCSKGERRSDGVDS